MHISWIWLLITSFLYLLQYLGSFPVRAVDQSTRANLVRKQLSSMKVQKAQSICDIFINNVLSIMAGGPNETSSFDQHIARWHQGLLPQRPSTYYYWDVILCCFNCFASVCCWMRALSLAFDQHWKKLLSFSLKTSTSSMVSGSREPKVSGRRRERMPPKMADPPMISRGKKLGPICGK